MSRFWSRSWTGSSDWLHSLKSGSEFIFNIQPVEAAGCRWNDSSWLADTVEAQLKRGEGKRDCGFERKENQTKTKASSFWRHTSFQASLLLLLSSSPLAASAPLLAFVYPAILCAAPGRRHMALSALLLSSINTVVGGNYRHVRETRRGGCTTAAAGSRKQAPSEVGDKNKAPGLVKVSERSERDMWYSTSRTSAGTRNVMEHHGTPFNNIEHHGTPLNTMKHHETPWNISVEHHGTS